MRFYKLVKEGTNDSSVEIIAAGHLDCSQYGVKYKRNVRKKSDSEHCLLAQLGTLQL